MSKYLTRHKTLASFKLEASSFLVPHVAVTETDDKKFISYKKDAVTAITSNESGTRKTVDLLATVSLSLASSYEDSQVIDLASATTITGTIEDLKYKVEVVSTSHGSFEGTITNSTLNLSGHFDGTLRVTAYSEEVPSIKAEQTISVHCDDYATPTYSVSDVVANGGEAVLATATSCDVTFKGTTRTSYESGKEGTTTTSTYSQTVSFAANQTTSEVTRSGSFTWNDVTVNWSVQQKASAGNVISIVTDANGYDYVDLGLPSGKLWATCNVGATTPEGYGKYYQWGGLEDVTDTSISCDWEHYKTVDGGDGKGSSGKFNTYKKNGQYSALKFSDDIAHQTMGGDWMMPSDSDYQELVDNCTTTWTTQNGVNGRLFTSKINGNTLFVPASGYRYRTSLSYVGDRGYLWWRSLYVDYPSDAWGLYFSSDDVYLYYGIRCSGQSVRGILEPTTQTRTTHGGVIAVVIADENQNNRIGNLNVYNHLQTLYLDGSVFDIDDLVIQTGGGSGSSSGSGSGGSASGIALPSTVTGTHFIEYVLDDDYRNRPRDFEDCKLLHLNIPTKYELDSNGYEYVDLGLPSGNLWAKFNVGATETEPYGAFFQWGNTTAYGRNTSDGVVFNWSGNGGVYPYGSNYNKLTKYNTQSDYGTVDNLTELELSDDMARANMGGDWLTPTDTDFEELLKYCDTTWTVQYGVNGRLFTSKVNGNTLFIPASGNRNGSSLYFVGSRGRVWSRSLGAGDPNYARYLYVDSGSIYRDNSSRYYGFSVRALL